MNPEEKLELDEKLDDDDNHEDDDWKYPDDVVPIPANYHLRPGRERSPWADMDVSERLMADPSYIDRI